MNVSEYHAAQAAKMTEAAFQAAIVGLAQRLNWRIYHTFDSRRSNAGWPDLVLARDDVVLFRELKTEKGKPSPDQVVWLGALTGAGLDAAIWRPRHWFDGTIDNALYGGDVA